MAHPNAAPGSLPQLVFSTVPLKNDHTLLSQVFQDYGHRRDRVMETPYIDIPACIDAARAHMTEHRTEYDPTSIRVLVATEANADEQCYLALAVSLMYGTEHAGRPLRECTIANFKCCNWASVNVLGKTCTVRKSLRQRWGPSGIVNYEGVDQNRGGERMWETRPVQAVRVDFISFGAAKRTAWDLVCPSW